MLPEQPLRTAGPDTLGSQTAEYSRIQLETMLFQSVRMACDLRPATKLPIGSAAAPKQPFDEKRQPMKATEPAVAHTPGPWKIQYGGFPTDDGFGISTDNAAAERVKIVAECWPCSIVDNTHRLELLSNARLIAAAPELLATVEEIHRAMTAPSRVMSDVTRSEIAAWLPMIEAVIAKAHPAGL